MDYDAFQVFCIENVDDYGYYKWWLKSMIGWIFS